MRDSGRLRLRARRRFQFWPINRNFRRAELVDKLERAGWPLQDVRLGVQRRYIMNPIVVQRMRTNPFPFCELEQERKAEKLLTNLRNWWMSRSWSGGCCCCSLKMKILWKPSVERSLEKKLLVGGCVVVVVVVVAKMKN